MNFTNVMAVTLKQTHQIILCFLLVWRKFDAGRSGKLQKPISHTLFLDRLWCLTMLTLEIFCFDSISLGFAENRNETISNSERDKVAYRKSKKNIISKFLLLDFWEKTTNRTWNPVAKTLTRYACNLTALLTQIVIN